MLFIKEIKGKEKNVFTDAIVEFVKNNCKEIELVADFEDKLKKFNLSFFGDYLFEEISEQIKKRKQAKESYAFIDESSDLCNNLSLKNAIQLYMEIDDIQEISFIIIHEISRTNNEVYDIIIKNEKNLDEFLKDYEIKRVS